MCVCMHVCMCVRMYVLYVCNVCMQCTYVCMHGCLYVCMYVMYACMYVCDLMYVMYECVYVCVM